MTSRTVPPRPAPSHPENARVVPSHRRELRHVRVVLAGYLDQLANCELGWAP